MRLYFLGKCCYVQYFPATDINLFLLFARKNRKLIRLTLLRNRWSLNKKMFMWTWLSVQVNHINFTFSVCGLGFPKTLFKFICLFIVALKCWQNLQFVDIFPYLPFHKRQNTKEREKKEKLTGFLNNCHLLCVQLSIF